MKRHTRLGDALWLVGCLLTMIGIWMLLVLAAWGTWESAPHLVGALS